MLLCNNLCYIASFLLPKIICLRAGCPFFILVGGALGIAFAASGLSQILIRDNQQFEIYPNGSTPIAAFLTAPTRLMPNVNATSATFAETGNDAGKK